MKTLEQEIEDAVRQELVKTNIIDAEDDYQLDANVMKAILKGAKAWLLGKVQVHKGKTGRVLYESSYHATTRYVRNKFLKELVAEVGAKEVAPT